MHVNVGTGSPSRCTGNTSRKGSAVPQQWEIKMSYEAELREGLVAAEALEVVFDHPEEAYAHAITKRLNKRYGEKHTHNLEVGCALRLMASLGVLENVESPPGHGRASQRIMYRVTKLGALVMGLLGHIATRAVKAA